MRLFTLIAPFIEVMPQGDDLEITGLKNDSRQVAPGDLFIAYPGSVTDGRQYMQQAIDAGAIAIVYEPQGYSLRADCAANIPLIALRNLNEHMAAIASRFYNYPSKKLYITGVTGTNGKTTIAYQLAQAYPLLGLRASYVGTLGYGEVQALKSLANTTPDALCLQTLLQDDVASGIEYSCMEVSSHALTLGRVDDIDFTQAIYTNLSLDHLDFHQTMDAYAMAKAALFSKPTLQAVIINQDDPHSELMQQQVPSTCLMLLYGLSDKADVQALTWAFSLSGSTVEVASPWGKHTLHLQSLGRFNIYNSLAVFASLMLSGVASVEAVSAVMGQLKPSPGRMEIVAQKPCVIVDYAHTPDALENVLLTLVELKPRQLWVVFGCGGDRDRTKRPIMGNIASQYADMVVLTNDNPRSEEPEAILREIRHGMPTEYTAHIIPDRREAIHYALSHAGEQDIVLIAGKGHENYQIIGRQKFPFSDQDVVRQYGAP